MVNRKYYKNECNNPILKWGNWNNSGIVKWIGTSAVNDMNYYKIDFKLIYPLINKATI